MAKDQARATHAEFDGAVISEKLLAMNKFVEGRICGNCNTGWMSRLENQAKNIGSKLILSQVGLADLNSDERLILARWAVKTVIVLNAATSVDYHSNVSAKHIGELSSSAASLPDGLLVVAQQHRGKSRLWWHQQANWSVYVNVPSFDQNNFRKLWPTSYKVTLQFGALLLCVAYWPSTELHYVLWRGVHKPLWLGSQPTVWYEPMETFLWDDEKEALSKFHTGVKLIQDELLLSAASKMEKDAQRVSLSETWDEARVA